MIGAFAFVRFILNLADSKDDVSWYEEQGFFPGFQALYAEGNVALLDLSANYRSDIYKRKLASGLAPLPRLCFRRGLRNPVPHIYLWRQFVQPSA